MKRFLAYFRAMNASSTSTGLAQDRVASVIGVMIFAFMLMRLSLLFMPAGVLIVGVTLSLAVFICASTTMHRPSLVNMFPASGGRKTVYFILFTVIMAAFGLAVVTIFSGLLVFIITSVVLIASGFNSGAEIEEIEAVAKIGPMGHALATALAVAVIGAALSVCFVKKRWLRNALTVAAPIIPCVPLEVYALITKTETQLFPSFDVSPACVPFLIVYFAAAVLLFAFGIFRVARFMKRGERT